MNPIGTEKYRCGCTLVTLTSELGITRNQFDNTCILVASNVGLKDFSRLHNMYYHDKERNIDKKSKSIWIWVIVSGPNSIFIKGSILALKGSCSCCKTMFLLIFLAFSFEGICHRYSCPEILNWHWCHIDIASFLSCFKRRGEHRVGSRGHRGVAWVRVRARVEELEVNGRLVRRNLQGPDLQQIQGSDWLRLIIQGSDWSSPGERGWPQVWSVCGQRWGSIRSDQVSQPGPVNMI